MKKLLAILLVLTMVLPMCVFVNAAGASDEIQPFYMVNWEGKYIEDFNYVYDLPQFYTKQNQGMTKLSVSCFGTGDPERCHHRDRRLRLLRLRADLCGAARRGCHHR